MTGWDLQHLYFVFQHTSWVLTEETANSHLENIAQFSQALRVLILLSVGFSIGCTIGYKNVLLWTLYICLFLMPPWWCDSQQSCLQVTFHMWAVSFDCSSFVFSAGDGANDVSMIQVADIGVGISGQEGMQVVYTKTAANDIRFHFKLVQNLPWRPSDSTVHHHTWDRVCRLSWHPGLSTLPGALKLTAAGFQIPNSRACCLSPNFLSLMSCQETRSLSISDFCGNHKDSHVPGAYVVFGWAVCVTVECCVEELRSEWG